MMEDVLVPLQLVGVDLTAIFEPVMDQDIVLPTAQLTQSEDVPRKEEGALLPPPSKASEGHGQAARQASNKTLDFQDTNNPSLPPASVLDVGFSKEKNAINHRPQASVQQTMEHLEASTQPRSMTSVSGVGFT
jgi:hypothetical protein